MVSVPYVALPGASRRISRVLASLRKSGIAKRRRALRGRGGAGRGETWAIPKRGLRVGAGFGIVGV